MTFLSSGVVCGRKAPKSLLPTSIAGVLRLRAIKPSVRDISAKRFAQDDGFVGGLEIQLVGYAENTKRSKKSQALRMTIVSEALSKNISRKGPRNCRSLDCARDDKGEGDASMESG